MENQKDVIAIILASGSGRRFGSELPKQFCMMNGRPLLMHTVDAFREVLPSENILVVINADMETLWREMCENFGYNTPKIAFGGDTRTKSLENALGALDDFDKDTVIMIHDGARPLVSEMMIKRMMKIPDGYVGAVPCLPVTDTLRCKDSDLGSHTVNRSNYVAVQTPQTFLLGTLRDTFRANNGIVATDDAALVQNFTGRRIALMEGDPLNIKITNPKDIRLAEAMSEIYRP